MYFYVFLDFKENRLIFRIKGIISLDDRLPNGWTALHLAVEENKIKMAKFLIDHGADIDGELTA